eukprot:scaffold12070_cov20-Tisochrysis_lutea.AAC.4
MRQEKQVLKDNVVESRLVLTLCAARSGEGEFPVEVQFRTHKMHYIAEYGFAAHWKYKEKLSNEDEWLDKLARVTAAAVVSKQKWLSLRRQGVLLMGGDA